MSRHRLPLLSASVCTIALVANMALADRISSSVKSSNTPAASAVQTFINPQLPNLGAKDPAVQKIARDQLIYEATSHSGTSATPDYGTLYADEIGKALAPQLKQPSLRARLNAAIVVAEVASAAYRAGGTASGLSACTLTCLKDKQAAVAIWGAKAAKYVLASDVTTSADPTPIAQAVFAAVKEHSESGPIVEEAFNSLTLEGDTFAQLKGAPEFQQNIIKVVPSVLDLVALRGQQYQAGGSVPSMLADRPVTVFLSVTAYQAINSKPDLLKRTLSVMGQTTCAMVQAQANGNASPELLEVIRAYGGGFDILGQEMQKPNIQAAGKAIEQISANTDSNKSTAMCNDLTAALKEVGADVANNGPGAAGAASQPAVARH